MLGLCRSGSWHRFSLLMGPSSICKFRQSQLTFIWPVRFLPEADLGHSRLTFVNIPTRVSYAPPPSAGQLATLFHSTMMEALTTGQSSPFSRPDSNYLTPPKSPRRPPISPRPSSSLLKLQKLGLELGPSGSSLSLHAPSYNSSIRTTPSDLDKPLPLEPPEIERRASSVYSVETTISNIIDLYGGATHHVERKSSVPNAHRSQAYRDTVAPLMARQYSGAESPPPLPLLLQRLSGADSPPPLPSLASDNDVVFRVPIPSPSIYQDFSPLLSPDYPDIPALPETARIPSPSIYLESLPISPPTSKYGMPSFVDSARNLAQKRPELVSPLSSAGSEDYHRQLAMDSLAPPLPRDSLDVRPVAFEGSDLYLPGPMSRTISHVVAPDMVPPPLDLNRSSRYLSPQATERGKYDTGSRDSFEDLLIESAQRASSAESSPDIYNHSPAQTPDASAEKLDSQRFTAEEKHRILSYASEEYPGMQHPPEISPIRTSKGSSLSQRAVSLIHAISAHKSSADKGSIRTSTETASDAAEYVPGGRKKLAIQPTSYQLYGEAAWDKDKDKKKRKKDQRSSKGSTRSEYEQERVGFLEGAKHKLTRTASEKRREKLKNSIKLVGPAEITKQRHAREDPSKWWE